MLVLSKPDLLKRIKSGSVVFDPPVSPSAIKQCSIDLRLGRVFSVFKPKDHIAAISLSTKSIFDQEDLWDAREEDFFTLRPQGFVLAQTLETVTIPADLMGLVEGRSSWARLGVGVHLTAPKIDPGYSNTITLELSNHGGVAVELAAGRDKPCQLILLKLSTRLSKADLYGGSAEDIFQKKAAR